MFVLNDDQKKRLRGLLNNAEALIAQENIRDFLVLLDNEILQALDDDYEPTIRSDALEDIYYEVYGQNPD